MSFEYKEPTTLELAEITGYIKIGRLEVTKFDKQGEIEFEVTGEDEIHRAYLDKSQVILLIAYLTKQMVSS
jgi:hypothetical protein